MPNDPKSIDGFLPWRTDIGRTKKDFRRNRLSPWRSGAW